MRFRAFSFAVSAVGVTLLGGCAGFGPGGPAGGAQSCVSWVDFEDAQAMYDDATIVVVGVADPADGTIELLSGPGERHRIEIEEIHKGDFDGDELWAAAPRDYCVAEPPQ